VVGGGSDKVPGPHTAQSPQAGGGSEGPTGASGEAEAGPRRHPCSAHCGLPAVAGKELTSSLLSVCVELLIPQPSQLRAATGAREQSRSLQSPAQPSRTPGLRSFPGTAWTPCQPHLALTHLSAFRSEPTLLEAIHATNPSRGEQTFLVNLTLRLLAGLGGADSWTD
jgi:hypothetical protein